MSHTRALHNPPIAVPHSGLPSHQNIATETDFLLTCEAYSRTLTDGRWRFSLEAADGEMILDAEDQELGDLNRLTLLAAVRGLESLEGPSSVTLLSNNRYLIRSLSKSLPRWRQNDFRWEHFGRRIDVQHADLWRRVDHALAIHRVQACLVSSCLVSHGVASDQDTRDTTSAIEDQENILDRSQQVRLDQPKTHSGVPAPSRRLRQLINKSSPHPQRVGAERRRGRFTAEDLES